MPPAGLQQPESADVLQQACRAADAALVGEVERERSRGDDRRCRTSVPSSDQVPELRNATLPDADTDATADAVSWQAGATTGVPAHAADTLACSGPIIVPGSTSGCSSRVGSPISSSMRVAHVRVRASMNCVVVATVYSAVSAPVSQ